MDAAHTLNKLKEQAEINAMKRLQDQFSTPDQLEQIEQHINRNEKRKVSKTFQRRANKKELFIWNTIIIYYYILYLEHGRKSVEISDSISFYQRQLLYGTTKRCKQQFAWSKKHHI